MPDKALSLSELIRVIAEALGLKPGDTIEVQRNKIDANVLKIIRHPQAEEA